MYNDVPFDEIVEEIELMSNIFIKIEKQDGLMSYDQYIRIFRILHNLKGTLSMCGRPEATQFVHLLEDYFLTFQNSKLSSAVLEYFISSSKSLLDNIIYETPITINFQITEKFKNEQTTIKEIFKKDSYKCDSTFEKLECAKESIHILLLSGSGDCQIERLIIDNRIQYQKYTSVNDIYFNLKTVKKVKTIIVNLEDSSFHLASFIRVLNKNLNHINILIIGNNNFYPDLNLFLADIHFQWIGSKNENLPKLIAELNLK